MSDKPLFTRRRLISGAANLASLAAASTLLPPNLQKALAQTPNSGSLKDVKHVVMLMQENRSFDHYFGTLSGVRGFGDPKAITLSTGKSVFHQPVQTIAPAGTTQYANPDGYLLPFRLDTR